MLCDLCNCQRNYSEKSGSEGSEDDDYVPYVPVKIRKQQMVSSLYHSVVIDSHEKCVFISCGSSVVHCHCLCYLLSPGGSWGTLSHSFAVTLSSIRWCVCVGKGSRKRNRKTVVESRKMRMRVSAPDPMSVYWTSTSISRRKLKVFTPSPVLRYLYAVECCGSQHFWLSNTIFEGPLFM